MKFINQLLREFADREYTPADVMSKVAASEKESDNYENTKKFGLQDSDGNVVLVYVAADQAEEFEDALGLALSKMEGESQPEIAELLFNMHERFNLVNVEWPNIATDEDEEATDEEAFAQNDPDEESEQNSDASNDIDSNDMSPPQDDQSAQTALDSVVQMMAADAEAKRQEALARAAEARAREAEAAAKIADNKLRSEEEVADMEAFYDTKTQEQKEAKKLAKLAKYRHEVKSSDLEREAGDYADALSAQEQENDLKIDTLGRDDELKAGLSGATDPETSAEDLESELSDFGVENEETEVPKKSSTQDRLKQIEDTINYLHSLRVQKQAYND